MGDRYFITRDASNGYFTDARTSAPRADAPSTAPQGAPPMDSAQTACSGSSPAYSTSSARIVRKYSLKQG